MPFPQGRCVWRRTAGISPLLSAAHLTAEEKQRNTESSECTVKMNDNDNEKDPICLISGHSFTVVKAKKKEHF